MRLSTRQITTGAILVALTLVASYTRLGEIPVPTPARAITWQHVPVIVAGIVMGPVVGGIVGLIWGFIQWLVYGAAFPDPTVHILPRILVGVLSGLTYGALFPAANRLFHEQTAKAVSAAAAAAAVVGTLTNTVGVLSLAYWRGYFPMDAIKVIVATHLPLELVAGVGLTLPIVAALRAINRD